jgi:hypothetical protein
MIMTEQSLFAFATMLLCVWGLVSENKWYAHSKYGKFLTARFGEAGGRRFVRIFLVAGMIIGLLIYLQILNPWRWS